MSLVAYIAKHEKTEGIPRKGQIEMWIHEKYKRNMTERERSTFGILKRIVNFDYTHTRQISNTNVYSISNIFLDKGHTTEIVIPNNQSVRTYYELDSLKKTSENHNWRDILRPILGDSLMLNKLSF